MFVKIKHLTKDELKAVLEKNGLAAWPMVSAILESNFNMIYPIIQAGPHLDNLVLCTIGISLTGGTCTVPIPEDLYYSLPEITKHSTIAALPLKKETS